MSAPITQEAVDRLEGWPWAPREPVATPAEREATRRAIGARWPEAEPLGLLAFLERFGGRRLFGRPTAPLAERSPWGEKFEDFSGFFAIGGRGDLGRVSRAVAGWVPAELLPVAMDPGGNVLAVGVRGPAAGGVWFVDHEHRETSWEQTRRMSAELDAAGVDPSRLDVHQIITRWHALHPAALRGAPGWSHVYRVADSLDALVRSLTPTAPLNDR